MVCAYRGKNGGREGKRHMKDVVRVIASTPLTTPMQWLFTLLVQKPSLMREPSCDSSSLSWTRVNGLVRFSTCRMWLGGLRAGEGLRFPGSGEQEGEQ